MLLVLALRGMLIAVRRTRFDDAPCPIARVTDLFGDWWTPLVLRDAMFGVRRFDALPQDLGPLDLALADQDFVSSTGSVTFLPGETSKTVAVQVKVDGAVRQRWFVAIPIAVRITIGVRIGVGIAAVPGVFVAG